MTLLRLALMALLAAGAGEPGARTDTLAWCAVVLATVTALLDAGGWPTGAPPAAGQATSGARFDMETDAVMVLVLSALVPACWTRPAPGCWPPAGCATAFVLAAGLCPWLSAPLPPSLRRKTVCVVQIVALIVCLGPIVTPPLAELIARRRAGAAGLFVRGGHRLAGAPALGAPARADAQRVGAAALAFFLM